MLVPSPSHSALPAGIQLPDGGTPSLAATRLVVAAAVLDSLSRPTALLCAARSYPPELVGQFELPGGKTEEDEAPEDALARELLEELNLEIRLGAEVLPPDSLAVTGADGAPAWPVTRGYRMRVWLAEPMEPGRSPQPGSSHQRVEWVRLEDTRALPWLPADLPILDAVLPVDTPV